MTFSASRLGGAVGSTALPALPMHWPGGLGPGGGVGITVGIGAPSRRRWGGAPGAPDRGGAAGTGLRDGAKGAPRIAEQLMTESDATEPEGATPLLLTRKQAAAACGVHDATLRRKQRDGKLRAALNSAGATVYSVVDLVAAGLLDPLAAAGPIEEVATRSRAERDLIATRKDLAVATAQLAQSRDEIDYLRRLLLNAQAA